MTPMRLLLVDDHPVVRQGYKSYLEAAGVAVVVAEAGNAQEALWAVRHFQPEVIVSI